MSQLEQRRFNRKHFLSNVLVWPLPGDFPFDAYALNLGQGGLTIISPHSLRLGQPVQVAIPIASATGPPSNCRLDARVAHASVESDGHIIGIAFARALSTEEFSVLQKILVGIGVEA